MLNLYLKRLNVSIQQMLSNMKITYNIGLQWKFVLLSDFLKSMHINAPYQVNQFSIDSVSFRT